MERDALDLEGTRERVDALRATWSAEHDPEAVDRGGPALLRWLERQRVMLKRLAGDDPEDAKSAAVSKDGIGLANQAESAARLFAEAERVELEESARGICVNMTCVVQGHLHHVVGPRMLAFLDCLVRQGRVDQSLAVTDAIVADFGWISREKLGDEEVPSAEDRVSLGCLRKALEVQAEYRDDTGIAERIETIDRILARPSGDGNEDVAR